MKRFKVTGMSCAACSARVEKAVKGVEGVDSCAVNLLTGAVSVEGKVSDAEVISAVVEAGYGAEAWTDAGATAQEEKNKINPITLRLTVSAALLLPLTYMAMGHHMWGFPLPSFLTATPLLIGVCQLVLALSVMIINRAFFINGFKSVVRGAPNMDTLVAIGSGASFVWSVITLIKMGSSDNPAEYLGDLYFESAAMILVLITVGKLLESLAKGKTTSAIRALMDLTPKTARVVRDGVEMLIPTEKLVKGDIFVLRPGDGIPADGVVVEGESAVNESALTGESIPVDKKQNDRVSSATVNLSGYLKCQATEVGEDTSISAVIRLVNDAVSTKAPIAKIADKVSGFFVPLVMGLALIAATVWIFATGDVGFALARGISVLVISCPCALGLATPVAIMVGSGIGAREGILFKTAEALELCGRAKIVALDKTGTVTKGKPAVTDLICAEGVSEEELLSLAAGLECFSEHPLASAVVKRAEELRVTPAKVSDFTAVSGSGVKGSYQGKKLIGANYETIKTYLEEEELPEESYLKLTAEGKTPLFFVLDERLLGIIAVADEIKEDAKETVRQLKAMGLRVVMLTGDNRRTAMEIAKSAEIDEVIAEVKPDGKEAVIRQLAGEGKTVMVGDGINDAPALSRAHVGIAMSCGTDIAIESADVVLTAERLSGVSTAIRLGRRVLKNIKENLFWAFFYNAVGIPLAGGAFIPLFGWELNPMFGAAAMSLSSFCVVTNALRLYLFKSSKSVQSSSKNQENINNSSQNTQIIVKVSGMMCHHCEGQMEKAMTELPFVCEASASHVEGTVTLTLSGSCDTAEIKRKTEEAGYKFKGIGT